MLRASRIRGALIGLCLAAGLAVLAPPAHTQDVPAVVVVPIQGTIDLGLAPLLQRAIREASEAGAAAVVLDINTFGGRVDAAVAMRDTLLAAPLPTIAFVDPRAISAGALIALATNTIVMSPGGTIGAAAPIVSGAGGAEPADEKTVSYLRKEFRATADRRGRPGELAEAMVDVDVAVPDVVESGKLLTLTTTEALAHGVADAEAADLAAALAAAGFDGAIVRAIEETWAETFVRFLTGTVISSMLLSIGLLGLLVELRTPGFGVPGFVGLSSIALFFWGHWIVQLAGWEELLLTMGGVVLMLVEAFVLPGFGLAGILGIVALIGGLGLALVGAGATAGAIVTALGQVAASILIALAGGLLLLRFLPRLPFGRRLILGTRLERDTDEPARATPHRLLGRRGTSLSPLRPAGIAAIDDARVDVVSEGGYIDADVAIVVTAVEGHRIVVRPAPDA